MKLTKLLEIKTELERFEKRLNEAILIAKNDNKKTEYSTNFANRKEVEKPFEERECIRCKQSAALKRSSTDLKMALYSIK